MKMKTSNIVAVLVVLGLVASPAFAGYTYVQIDPKFPSKDLTNVRNLKVDQSGDVSIAWRYEALFYNAWTDTTTVLVGPAGGTKRLTWVYGRTALGEVAAMGKDGFGYTFYYDGTSWVDPVAGVTNSRTEFYDQNETHGVAANWQNGETYVVDFATGTGSLWRPDSNTRPAISPNGMISSRENLWDGVAFSVPPIISWRVNDSANTAGFGLGADVGKVMFYDHTIGAGTGTTTEIPPLPGRDPATYDYTVEGMNNSNVVVGNV